MCALLMGMISCGPSRETTDSEPIAARIGDSVIFVKDVEQEIAWRVERGAPVPAREVLLKDMVERRLLVQKALAAGLDKAPDVRRSWENLLISRYKEEHVGKETREVKVTDEEVLKRYESNSARYERAGQARLAVLTMALPASLAPDQREAKLAAMREAHALAAQPSEGPGFGPLAVRYSEDDVTRHRGGDAGWLDEGVAYRWPDEVVRAGFGLPVGGVSAPIEAASAIFLVKKLDARPPTKVAIDRVRDQLRREIQAEKRRSVEASFAQASRAGVIIETYPDRLAGIQIPVPAAKSVPADELPPSIP